MAQCFIQPCFYYFFYLQMYMLLSIEDPSLKRSSKVPLLVVRGVDGPLNEHVKLEVSAGVAT